MRGHFCVREHEVTSEVDHPRSALHPRIAPAQPMRQRGRVDKVRDSLVLHTELADASRALIEPTAMRLTVSAGNRDPVPDRPRWPVHDYSGVRRSQANFAHVQWEDSA